MNREPRNSQTHATSESNHIEFATKRELTGVMIIQGDGILSMNNLSVKIIECKLIPLFLKLRVKIVGFFFRSVVIFRLNGGKAFFLNVSHLENR